MAKEGQKKDAGKPEETKEKAEKGKPEEATGADETAAAEGREGSAAPGDGSADRGNDSADAARGANAPVAAASIFGNAGVPATTQPPSEEIMERISEVAETLESLGTNIYLPIVHFKDDFRLSEDDDPCDMFDGVLIFTKESNIYYEGRYKAGDKAPPRCFAPDGRVPTSADPVHPNCAECPKNQWGSGPEGQGKACKNTRPLFILTFTPEGTLSLIPKVLRVPPTSLPIAKAYLLRLAADYGSYYSVRTTFEVFKKSESQTYHNIKFRVAGRLDKQEKSDVKFVRNELLPIMQRGNFGIDEETAAGPSSSPKPPPRGGEMSEEAF